MSALTSERLVRDTEGELVNCKIKGATKILQGGLVALDATGFLVRATKTTGLTVIGVAKDTVDNTAGADGALGVDVKISRGTRSFKMQTASAGGLVDQKLIGKPVYVEDDQTVTAIVTGSSQVGICTGVDRGDGLPFVRFLI